MPAQTQAPSAPSCLCVAFAALVFEVGQRQSGTVPSVLRIESSYCSRFVGLQRGFKSSYLLAMLSCSSRRGHLGQVIRRGHAGGALLAGSSRGGVLLVIIPAISRRAGAVRRGHAGEVILARSFRRGHPGWIIPASRQNHPETVMPASSSRRGYPSVVSTAGSSRRGHPGADSPITSRR